ncbi:VOC family protein [Kribbella kalugense]|uniref:Catechol 2,3-dioxygenase-like lactoylglutathione lyase family enzyme n=1 Tax=Kribbella kalugense TaxID=2512221 RepID=A0A4R8A3I6_9ACTN|nr:VOC family protein [Kribbella kalugense]TDW24201.1 catechol 2,3-dioxygenase-like lactoylglutathione lyase family enzyme [Kribbella kalugense]
MSMITQRSTKPPLLRPTVMANGTIPSRDLTASRNFYEDVFGAEVAVHSPGRLVLRLGGKHTYLVEEQTEEYAEMVLLNHNGWYLDPGESVDDAHAKIVTVKDRYGVQVVTKPMWQHGSYAFFLQDRDGNWWEFYHERTSERQDLSGGPQLTADQVREWFQARRARDEASEADR